MCLSELNGLCSGCRLMQTRNCTHTHKQAQVHLSLIDFCTDATSSEPQWRAWQAKLIASLMDHSGTIMTTIMIIIIIIITIAQIQLVSALSH